MPQLQPSVAVEVNQDSITVEATMTTTAVDAATAVIEDIMTSIKEDIGKIASNHLHHQWRPICRSP